jgi:formylglycine-generating enzyme required for sulfatase activity
MPSKHWFLCAVTVVSGDLACAVAGNAAKISSLAPEPASVAGMEPPTGAGTEAATGLEMVYVKGGCFPMGNAFEFGGPEEKPVHEVCVDDFHMGKYEVTQGLWQEIMGSSPSDGSTCGNACPVDGVSWKDVQAFLARLNARSGDAGVPAGACRLPTEAEWEYAARSGGRSEKYSGRADGGLDDIAWYSLTAEGAPHPVGLKASNGLGLHDMTGNVWEWTSDWYSSSYYSSSPRDNPTGPSSGDARVLRGGGFRNDDRDVRASCRNYLEPHYRGAGKGFRLVRSATQAR